MKKGRLILVRYLSACFHAGAWEPADERGNYNLTLVKHLYGILSAKKKLDTIYAILYIIGNG